MISIYSFWLIVHGWHLFIWCRIYSSLFIWTYCTSVASIHLDLLNLGGIYIIGTYCSHFDLLYMDGIYSFGFIVLGVIYSFGLMVHGWHLFILTWCTWMAFIHIVGLYMGGIYSFGIIVHMGGIYSFWLDVHGWQHLCTFGRIVYGFHLFIWTNCTWVAFIHLDLLYMGIGIYSFGLLFYIGWHLFIWTYCTSVASIHLDLLYMGIIFSFGLIVHGWHLFIWTYCIFYTWVSIYSFGLIVHGWHLFIWTYCTWVAFIHLDLLYMGGIYSFGLIVHGGIIHLDLLYMGGIYSSGLIVQGWHLFIWTYCIWVSFTHMY